MKVNDRFIHTRHGRIHALEAGRGAPLVLMHTLGGSAHQFIEALPLLGERYHVLALDMVGHGDSDPLVRHLSMEQYAESVIDVADWMHADRLNVFGQSVGGYLATALAANWKSRIGKCIIGEAPPRTLADYEQGWAATEEIWATVLNTFEQVQPRMRNLTQDVFKRWNIDRSKAGAKTLTLTYWAIREFDFTDAVRRIDVPAQFVLGEKSMGPLQSKYEAMSKLPIRVMKNCGHFLSIDDPAELTRVVMDFIGD